MLRASVALVVVAAFGQLPGSERGRPTRQTVGNIYEQFGRPFRAPLEDIVSRPSFYSKPPKNVRVQGMVDPGPGEHYLLVDRSYRVVLIQAHNFDGARMMRGRPVEVVGVVRELENRYETYSCGATTSEGRTLCNDCPEPMCEHPDLPMLPTVAEAGVRVSITVWSISDASDIASGETDETGTTILDIIGSPANWIDQDVTVMGQFCGRGLCGPEPAGPIKSSDWLIARDDATIWITGKRPKGKGWELDPTYAGDTKWWLTVTGKVVVEGSAVGIKAKKLSLERAPPN